MITHFVLGCPHERFLMNTQNQIYTFQINQFIGGLKNIPKSSFLFDYSEKATHFRLKFIKSLVHRRSIHFTWIGLVTHAISDGNHLPLTFIASIRAGWQSFVLSIYVKMMFIVAVYSHRSELLFKSQESFTCRCSLSNHRFVKIRNFHWLVKWCRFWETKSPQNKTFPPNTYQLVYQQYIRY